MATGNEGIFNPDTPGESFGLSTALGHNISPQFPKTETTRRIPEYQLLNPSKTTRVYWDLAVGDRGMLYSAKLMYIRQARTSFAFSSMPQIFAVRFRLLKHTDECFLGGVGTCGTGRRGIAGAREACVE